MVMDLHCCIWRRGVPMVWFAHDTLKHRYSLCQMTWIWENKCDTTLFASVRELN